MLYLDILASRGPADRIVPRAVFTDSYFRMKLPLGRWVHDELKDELPSIRTPEFVAVFRRMSSLSWRYLRIHMVLVAMVMVATRKWRGEEWMGG